MIIVDTLQTFAEFIRRGSVGQGRRVGTQIVQVALLATSIVIYFKLAAEPNLCYKVGVTPRYWKSLEQQIEGYYQCTYYPVPQAKLVIPVTVP